MAARRFNRLIARTALARAAMALALATALVGPIAAGPGAPTASALSRWTGSIDLYRPGVFTTQKTWLWCTAADVQIMRNIVDHAADHSTANQRHYFDYMRAHNRYRIPVTDGVDPAGWTAGLRRYVDSRYRLVASSSFNSALRSAVTNLRKTHLPVAITVSHGNHAWVLTGFSATADPAVTSRFTVTSVRVVGPLWGLQSRSYGYDMRPDTKLTPGQLQGFFTPWHYTSVPMAWEDRWVSVQPIPVVPAIALSRPKAISASRAPPLPSTALAAPEPSASGPTPGGLAAIIATSGDRPSARQTPPAANDGDPPPSGSAPPWAIAAAVILIVAGVIALARVTGRRRAP